MPDLGIGEAAAASGAGGGLFAGLGDALAGLFGGGAAAAAPAAAGLGEAAAASAPLDLLSFGSAAGTALPEAAGAIVPATGALASGLATEPLFAPAAAGAFAPGLDTSAAGLGDVFGTGSSAAVAGPGVTSTSAPSALNSVAAGNTPSGGLTAPATAAPAAPTAGAVSAPADVVPQLGADPTAALGAGGVNTDTSGLLGATTPNVTVGPPPAGATPGSGGFLDTLTNSLSPSHIASGIGDSITKNPLGLALGVGGLGYSALQGKKQSAAENALAQEAQQQQGLSSQLDSYLTSGTLPAGLQASVTQAVQSAKAKAISNMAAQGLSTDPTKNTALAAELAQIDQQTPILTAQIGQQLLQSGQQAAGLSSQVYTALANIDQTQTAAVGKAIASMAAALSGKTPGVSVGGLNISAG
jgi:hypothetical protein